MKRRILSLCLALLLTVSLLPKAAAFVDTQGHWAEAYIDRAVAAGLFKGVSESEFEPESPMTRAMFVTVLGRMAGIRTDEWQLPYLRLLFSDVEPGSWYAPYVAWAAHQGITNGTDLRRFSPNENVTREQMATLLYAFLRLEHYEQLGASVDVPAYTDAAGISAWAVQSVTALSAAGLFTGSPDYAHGGLCFLPGDDATRAECATLFCRVFDLMQRPQLSTMSPASVTLPQSSMTLNVGDFTMLLASVLPIGSANPNVIWYSDDPACVSVDLSGGIYAAAPGTTQIHAVTANKRSAACTVTVRYPPSQAGLASGSMTKAEKLKFIYGTTAVSDYRTYYTSQEHAKSNQTTIQVKVWVISSGQKVTQTMSLTVHRNLAATVEAIFAEIYALPEKPPIHALGGWRWRSYETSEHNMGLAIDVNPAENPYVSSGGNAYSSGFRPGEDPYSIPIGGSVDQIFAKYGFTRGIYWRNGNKDYMHYSFFGT